MFLSEKDYVLSWPAPQGFERLYLRNKRALARRACMCPVTYARPSLWRAGSRDLTQVGNTERCTFRYTLELGTPFWEHR